MKRQPKEPERTFLFRVTPEGMPRVFRIVELSEKQSLHHLHLVIHQGFSLKGKSLYAFYLSGKHWDPESEYGGPLAGSPRKSKKALLGKLALERARPFLYLFNFEKQNWFEIEWIEEKRAEPSKNYPRLLEGEGELPTPVPPLEDALPPPLKTLLQNLRPALLSWDPAATKPRSPKEVREARNLVEALYKILQEKGESKWPLLDEATGMLLGDWLLSLPPDFVRRGLAEEALRLCEFFASYCLEAYFKCEKALVLASIDKKRKQKAALEQISEVAARYPLLAEAITKQTGFPIEPVEDRGLHLPEDPRIWTKIAEFLWKIDHVGPAERLFRRALDLALDDIYERELVLAKLIAMLEENERQDEAIELIRSELDRG